jgi:hypothetical protein
MKRDVLAAASPVGWPPPQHGAAARRRRAAAPQNTTNSHSETLSMELVWPAAKTRNLYSGRGRFGFRLSYADDGEMGEEFVGSGFLHVGDEDLGGFGADSAQGG